MSYSFLGQTQTRTPVPPEQTAAMNAPVEKLPEMCRAGNKYACDLAKIPQLTDQQKAEMAARRDQQAAADREALARRLENVGQTQVAQAVRTQQDVQYKSSGPSFTEIASGISSILNPLAAAGAGVYQSQQQAQLAKLQLKQQVAPSTMPIYFPQPTSSNTLLIAGVAGGAVLFLVIILLAVR